MTRFSPYYKLNILLLSLVLFVSLTFVSHFFVPTFLQNMLLQDLILSPSSRSFDGWQKSNIPIYTKFYLFNLTNAERVLEGDKPVVQQLGPYIFRHTFEKVNITWDEHNHTVQYRQVKRWTFEPSLTERSLDDEIVHLNVPLMSAVFQIESAPMAEQYTAYESLNSLVEAFHMKAVLRTKVRHLLFEGYNDSLLEAASRFYPTQVSQTKFGWFVGRNDTSSDGLYRIFTGQSSSVFGSDLGLLDTWNNHKSLSRWHWGDECDGALSLAHTSAGDLQPPFFVRKQYHLLSYFGQAKADQHEPSPIVRILLADLCRVVELQSPRPVTYRQHLTALRYGAGPSLFDYSLARNRCYCHKGRCPPNGLYHLAQCAKGSPMFVSLPHFLHSDPSVLDKVHGLTPSEADHELFLDYEKNLAIPVNVNIRLQINLFIKKTDKIEIMETWPDDLELYLPQFWTETTANIDDSMVTQIGFLVNILPLILLAITASLALVASILLLILIVFVFTNQMFFGLNQIGKYESVSILSPNATKAGPSEYVMHELEPL